LSKDEVIHFVVEAGPEKGRLISVPAEGGRVGRSSSNEIVLDDAAMSRFHCRVFFKDGQLWVSDLASTNETLVNHKPIQECRLHVGDRIEIGETILKVIADGVDSISALPVESGAAGAIVDLGLSPASPAGKPLKSRPWRVIGVALLMLALVAIAIVLRFVSGETSSSSVPPPSDTLSGLDIQYEKEQADSSNIFRYTLDLRDETLEVQIDNIEDGRHVVRRKEVDPALLLKLARDIERTDFFKLDESYEGLSPDVWDSRDLTITIGLRTHRVQVRNRIAPSVFTRVSEMIEEFAQNELGLAALALPPDKLIALADEATLQGQKLFDERDVNYANLFMAIRAFQEAQWYLETIEPKPAFYATAVSGYEQCKELLDKRYQDYLFQAERAIQLRDWPAAAAQLRIICEIIPDRSDERYKKAWKKLLDMERRIER